MVQRRVAASMILIALIVTVSVFGQTTAQITGTVTTDGVPLPGVTVTITSLQMQGSRTATTLDTGGYTFQGVPPGEYTVKFELSGMAPVTKSAQVGLGQTARADADLKVSAIAEAITVTASA